MLAALKNYGGKYSDLASVMKKYPQHLVNVKATDAQKKAFSTDADIKAIIAQTEALLSRKESSGRLVIRPSGTEPVVRIMVECISDELTVSICEKAANDIKAILTKY